MPTPKPPPVAKPKDEREKNARVAALEIVDAIFTGLCNYSYNTRSHMPNGVDYTNFTDKVKAVGRFCHARPDWTMEIVRKALGVGDPVNYARAWRAIDAAYRLADRWVTRESCDPTYGDALRDALDRELGLDPDDHEVTKMPLHEDADNEMVVAIVKAAIGEANVYFRSYNIDHSMHGCSIPHIEVEVCGEVEGKLRLKGSTVQKVGRFFETSRRGDELADTKKELTQVKKERTRLKRRLAQLHDLSDPCKRED